MRKDDVIAHVFQTKAETIFDENGKITAYQAGTVTITAMTGFNNEVTASCEVTISPADLS